MNFSFCIRKFAVAFYMINEIQPKIKFQNIVQCPFKLSKDRDHYYSKAHKTNNPQDWLMARKLRNQVNKLNKNLKKHYCNNAINENIKDSKKLWCTIRKLIPKNVSAVSNVQTKDGYTCNDEETANQFNDYFTSIGNDLAKKFKHDSNIDNYDANTSNVNVEHECFKFDAITPDFVFDQICSFSNNKSTGVSNISTKLLKLAAPIICHPLVYISVTFPCLHLLSQVNGRKQRLHLYTRMVTRVTSAIIDLYQCYLYCQRS